MGLKFLHIIRNHAFTYRYEWALIILVLLFFWPFTFEYYIPKWDNIDGYLPYRHMVANYFTHGTIPLWHPFEHLGNPIYSDMQSGVWNPVVWLLTLIYGNYDIQALTTELLLCYIIAGIGMFRLSVYLFSNSRIAFILAVSYAFSGFMVGSSQLMVFLLGVAWLPWCTYYLIRLLNEKEWKYVFYLALCLALHTTSASPAFTILLVYFFIGVIVYHLIKNKSAQDYKKLFLQLLVLAILLVVLLAPYINAFYEFFPYFNRTETLEKERLLINPFTTKEYISFILPYTTVADTQIFSDTDLSLRNGYFGLIGLSACIGALFIVRKAVVYFLFFGVIISLLLASGEQSGVYEYFAKLPGLGHFRHSSLFRSYAIFLGLLMAGLTLKHLYDKQKLKRGIIIFSACLVTFSFVAFFLIKDKVSMDMIETTLKGVWHFTERSITPAAVHIAINILLLLLIVFICLVQLLFLKHSGLRVLSVFVVLEFFVLTQLLAPTTVYQLTPYREAVTFFNSLPSEFNNEYNQTPLKKLKEGNDLHYVQGFWRNLSILHKRPAYDGYNPTRFKTYDELIRTSMLDYILENPLMYSPVKRYIPGDSLQSGLIWGIKTEQTKYHPCEVRDITIQRNSFTAMVENSSSETSWLILNQNYHHLWKVYLGAASTKVEKVNNAVLGVRIPPNFSGTVEFRFESPRTKWMLLLSILGYLTVLIFLLRNYSLSFKSKTTSSSHS